MKSVTVVGSGIVGLTTAIILQEAGFQVRVLAKDKFENTLSQKVGAVWFPCISKESSLQANVLLSA
jgi:D-amino-acid oxidase